MMPRLEEVGFFEFPVKKYQRECTAQCVMLKSVFTLNPSMGDFTGSLMARPTPVDVKCRSLRFSDVNVDILSIALLSVLLDLHCMYKYLLVPSQSVFCVLPR